MRVRRLVAAAIALALLVVVFMLARPAEVWHLVRTTDLSMLGVSALVAVGGLVMRGLRLSLLLEHGELEVVRATLIAAAAQASAVFAPARTGELALPWLLEKNTSKSFTTGVGTLLAARTLDFATLGIWAGAAILAVGGLNKPVTLAATLFLLAIPLLLPAGLAVADRFATRLLAPRGLRGRRWTRRIRRVRHELVALRRRPLRLASASVASLLMWGLQWGLAWTLLIAIGFRWPFQVVVAGATASSMANLLPINIVGNLGTLEASWTATFTALGIPLQEAAATGLATHIWGLVITAVFGVTGWAILSSSRGKRAKG